LRNDARSFAFLRFIDRRPGRWEEAIRNLERAAALHPRNVTTIRDLAITYFTLRRYTEANAMFTRALVFEPRNTFLRVAAGRIRCDAEADTRTLRAVLNTIEAE